MTIQYQNTLEDYCEMTDAIAAARRPVNSPMQIVVLMVVFGGYYFITRYLWQKAGDTSGELAWVNMWIAIVAFGFTWLAISIPHSLRARRFPWLTRRQFIALGSFIALIGALVFQHWMNVKYNAKVHSSKMTWQMMLPHSIWLVLLLYVSSIAAHNHRTSLSRHWEARPDLHRHETVEITAEGLNFSDTETKHDYRWASFVKAEETRNLFLLFSHESGAIMVPKRAFAGDEEISAMRNLIKLIRTIAPAFEVQLAAAA